MRGGFENARDFLVFMATKNILLAIADNQIIADINEALGNEWLTTPVASGADALALLEAGSFDALLVDFNLGDAEGSELLNQAAEKCPDITRFLLAYEADLALVAATISGSHEILPKPIEAASLRSRVERGLSDASPSNAESEPAAAVATAAPVIPAIYNEILQALESPEATCQQVGDLIASDDTLIQETLMLTRSAYLGLPQRIVEPVEAVEVLGLETVKALVMALRFLAEHSQSERGFLSLEQVWEHSKHVAQIARDLVLFETKDRAVASQALTAGLLHDLGKVVLATNYDDLYGRVHSLARKQPVPLWEIEKEMFGANHGEIGACLLGMWNMPSAIVDAVALHHEPPLGEHDHLTPLAAVHIANVLEHQVHPSDEFRVMPVVSTPFLNELGLLQRLPIWRATFANQRSRTKASEAEPMVQQPVVQVAVARAEAVSQTANSLPAPAAETKSVTAAPAPRSELRQWIYTGVAAVVVCALALLFQLEMTSDDSVRVHAREIDTQHVSVTAPVTPAPQAAAASPSVAPASAETVAPVTASVEPAGVAVPVARAASVASEPVVIAMVPPAAAATEIVVTNDTKTNAPSVTSVPFKLNGIIYGVSNPSATVNGKAVYVGEKVNGATVLSIGRSEVVLNVNGERKTITLPAVH